MVGTLCNVTLSKEAGHWYASFQMQVPDVLPAGLAPTLGIDLGVASFAATSEGEVTESLAYQKAQACRLRRYQKAFSRRKKGGANWRKAVTNYARLHAKMARQRADWQHKLTTALADCHSVIAIEDLQVSAMSVSARGTAAAPGRNVKTKAGLNRAIMDAGWGMFRRKLEYKTSARGGEVIAVSAAYSSQECRMCGHTDPGNRKVQAVFRCLACGHTEHADVHAAKNILARGESAWREERESASGAQPNQLAAGHAVSAHGEVVRPAVRANARQAASTKWEPTEEAEPG
jgi:putative transposase